ncbi:MAG: sigma-70 family RNA polymerase sigma factor [Actinomycetota bacterium]
MSALSDLDDATLFARLPDEDAREALVVRHRPLAMYVARKFTGRGESLEDRSPDASRAYTAASLDAPIGEDDGFSAADTLAVHDDRFENLDAWQSVAPLLRELPGRERTILYMRFFEEKTQTEIAQELGISQMHVSRLLARTLAGLRQGAGA